MAAILMPSGRLEKAGSLTDLGCNGLPCARILLIFEVGAKVLEGYLVQLECSLIIPSIVLSDGFLHVLCAWVPHSGQDGLLQAVLSKEHHAHNFLANLGKQYCRLSKSPGIYLVRHCLHPICTGQQEGIVPIARSLKLLYMALLQAWHFYDLFFRPKALAGPACWTLQAWNLC